MYRSAPSRRLFLPSLIVALLTTLIPSFPLRSNCAAQGVDELRLTLPAEIFLTPQAEYSIYFDNVVLTQTPEAFEFRVESSLGKVERRRWTVTPQAKHVGRHPITIRVFDSDGKPKATASSTLVVTARQPTYPQQVRLLIIGDSLTHATAYPNEIARLLSLPANPKWRMLGTHRPKQAAPGVAHEGYGGWTWQRFVSKYEPNPDGTHRKRSSPFVMLGDNGKPELNVSRYFAEKCNAEKPDFVIIMLGINDCFSAPVNDPKGLDARINQMFGQADILLGEIRRAAPKAEIGICLTTPPNSREAAFQTNYKGRYPRWGWKRIQHRLVQRQLARFAGQESNGLHVIPTQLNLDPVDGYPANNGVHPNGDGYKQIGVSVYCWLNHRFHSRIESQDKAAP